MQTVENDFSQLVTQFYFDLSRCYMLVVIIFSTVPSNGLYPRNIVLTNQNFTRTNTIVNVEQRSLGCIEG